MPRPSDSFWLSLSRSWLMLAGAGCLAAALAVASCAQGTGDRCEYDGDCIHGDRCNNAGPNGTCVPNGTILVSGTGGSTGTGGAGGATGGAGGGTVGAGGDTGSVTSDAGTDEMPEAAAGEVGGTDAATADDLLADTGSSD